MEHQEIYYWETEINHGCFKESSDDSAVNCMPKSTVLLYKESNTKDGLPFIIIYRKQGA